jgi:hypothetical protein
MDWQQGLALLIVAGTAAAFLWNRMRPKKFSFEKDTHCGCSSPGQANARAAIGPAQTIQFRARKGERPSIIVKNG